MRVAFILFLMMFLVFNLQATEQPEQKPELKLDFKTLTLEDVIAYALEHSPQIKQAEITTFHRI